METLLEDYKRKLKTAESMLENGMTFGDEQENRIKIKASVYRSAIVDIERAMARQQQQSSANCAIFDVRRSAFAEIDEYIENSEYNYLNKDLIEFAERLKTYLACKMKECENM